MDIEITGLKLELKQWESNFMKNNGRKPTKNDAAGTPEIQKKYDKFVLLKRSIQDENLRRKQHNDTKENQSTPSNTSNLEDSSLTSRKILSPKNGEKEEVATNSVWGSNLLKKNSIVVDEGAEDAHKDETTEGKKDKSPVDKISNWRDNIRKNIGISSVKRLPTNLKSRSKRVRETLNNTLGLDNSLASEATPEEKDTSEDNNIFGHEIKIMKTNTFNSPFRSPNISSPMRNSFAKKTSCFGIKSSQKSSLMNKSISVDVIQDDDLSDLQSFKGNKENATDSHDEDTLICDKSAVNDSAVTSTSFEASNLNPEVEKELEPFQDETESFMEANFREKSKPATQFSSDNLPVISYDSVCLSTDKNTSVDKTSDKALDSDNIDSNNDKTPDAIHTTDTKSSSSSSRVGGRKIPQTNFVRLNMKKKCFVKRGGGGNFLRKQVFRQKLARKGYSNKSGWKGRSGGACFRGGGQWKGGGDVGYRDRTKDKCFKCGGTGHWSSKCKGEGFRQKKPDPEEEQQNKETLEEIVENIDLITAAIKGESNEILQPKLTVSVADPVLENEDPITENPDVMEALGMFKYNSFRPGQERAISRILRGLPTLLVLSTGSGKSLCYQLPAYLYAIKCNAITLVISPLVSLMDDQVRGLPRQMKAARIHSGMTKEQKDKAMLEVESGKIHVLLVSPEAITSWAGMSPKYSPLARLPPIAFACIDECHCLSEWSHAFRPSYLRVCQVLHDQLGVKCLVGLTATATMDTCASVSRQLGITDISDGVIAKIDIPDNLVLTVSKDKYKDEGLTQLLLGDRFSKLDSVIVYCTRRDEASRIAGLLRVKMQDMATLDISKPVSDEEATQQEDNSRKRKRKSTATKSGKRKVVTLDAECYHAGMSTSERRRIQTKFMNGTLRVVVATVAFGMGIDKQDVRAVIHYNMPMSFERYVQEVGRAGRDGKPAHCHLFLDSVGGDLCELSRHSYGKTIDRYTIKKFVKKVFPKCDCDSDNEFENECSGHFSAIDIDGAIESLDVTKESLETLLCYLEIEKLIEVYLPTTTRCTLQFYGGPGQMIKTAKKCDAVAVALKLAKTKENETKVKFSAMKVADELKMDLTTMKKLLRYLTYDTSLSSVASEVGKSGIEVDFSQMSFCLKTKRKATDEFFDDVTDLLLRRVIAQENKELSQLRLCHQTMQKFSYPNVGNCRNSADVEKSSKLKSIITDYFRQTQKVKDTEEQLPSISPAEENELRGCVRQFLHVHSNDLEHRITGRAIARIFHGIDSPRYPARNWGPVRRFWRSKLNIDFNLIRKIATDEIVGVYR